MLSRDEQMFATLHNRSVARVIGVKEFFYVRVSLNNLLINDQIVGIRARHVQLFDSNTIIRKHSCFKLVKYTSQLPIYQSLNEITN